MLPNPWLIVAALIALAAAAFGGYRMGYHVRDGEQASADLTRAEKIIVRQKVVEREVPKIVTKVVTKTVTVTKEVDHVITKVEHDIPADCVLPDRYGVLLVSAARGLDPDAPGIADGLAGAYGCREVLAATLHDLKAGWINTARLEGLQAWARLITAPDTAKDATP